MELAATELNRAIELDSGYAHPVHNLALVQLAHGRYEHAFALARRALALDESKENKALCARCLKEAPSVAAAWDLRPLLLRALCEPWARPNDLVSAVVRHLMSDPATWSFIDRGARPIRVLTRGRPCWTTR